MWVRKRCSGENKIRLEGAVQRRELLRLNHSLWQQLKETVVFLFSTNGQFQNHRPTVKLLSYCQTDDRITISMTSNSPSISRTHDWRLAAWKLTAGLNRSGANQCVLCTYVAMIILSNAAVFARDCPWNIERSFKASRHFFLSESWRHPRQWLPCMCALIFAGKCLATEILIYFTEKSTRRFNKAANCLFRFQMSPFVTQFLF